MSTFDFDKNAPIKNSNIKIEKVDESISSQSAGLSDDEYYKITDKDLTRDDDDGEQCSSTTHHLPTMTKSFNVK